MSNSENSTQVNKLVERIYKLKTKILGQFFDYLDSEPGSYDPAEMNKTEEKILELQAQLQEAKLLAMVTPKEISSESEKWRDHLRERLGQANKSK